MRSRLHWDSAVVKESSLHMWLSLQLFIYFCLQLSAQLSKPGHEGEKLMSFLQPDAHEKAPSLQFKLKAPPRWETHEAEECLWTSKGDKPPEGVWGGGGVVPGTRMRHQGET